MPVSSLIGNISFLNLGHSGNNSEFDGNTFEDSHDTWIVSRGGGRSSGRGRNGGRHGHHHDEDKGKSDDC